MSWLKENWFKLFIALFLLAVLFWVVLYPDEPSESAKPGSDSTSADYGCNVWGIELRGELVTYRLGGETEEEPVDQTSSEEIVNTIQEAESDPKVKAILLEVDSPGGSGVAAEEIANALKYSTKPTVAQIRESGVSAAYWSATGAKTIFASANSDVGGIGVTMSYLQNVNQNTQNGLEFIELNTGKFKNAGDPNKPLTAEEQKLFQRDLDIMLDNFISDVAHNRSIPLEEVRKLADGSSMLGTMALQNKLIDKIGGQTEVKRYLKEKIGEDPEICW